VVVVEDHVVLVGRDDELARLGGLVGDLVGGRGGSVWVEGEPGIGKSALLAAGLAGAQRQGCRVFWAAGEELGQRFPLRVMLDCLQVGPRSPDPARREIAGLLQGGQSTGRQSARALADPVPAVSERLLALVDRQCASTPVLLVVDDLQWADEASLSLWHRLGRVVDQHRTPPRHSPTRLRPRDTPRRGPRRRSRCVPHWICGSFLASRPTRASAVTVYAAASDASRRPHQ